MAFGLGDLCALVGVDKGLSIIIFESEVNERGLHVLVECFQEVVSTDI